MKTVGRILYFSLHFHQNKIFTGYVRKCLFVFCFLPEIHISSPATSDWQEIYKETDSSTVFLSTNHDMDSPWVTCDRHTHAQARWALVISWPSPHGSCYPAWNIPELFKAIRVCDSWIFFRIGQKKIVKSQIQLRISSRGTHVTSEFSENAPTLRLSINTR